MTEIIVAGIAAVASLAGIYLNRRGVNKLETKNDEQHARGYSLLESIDTRTIAMDAKLDEHGERIVVLEHEVSDLKQ